MDENREHAVSVFLQCIYLCKVIFKYVRNLCKIDEMAQEFKCAQVSIGIGPEIEISAELGISITVLILYLTLGVVHVRKQRIIVAKVYVKINR